MDNAQTNYNFRTERNELRRHPTFSTRTVRHNIKIIIMVINGYITTKLHKLTHEVLKTNYKMCNLAS